MSQSVNLELVGFNKFYINWLEPPSVSKEHIKIAVAHQKELERTPLLKDNRN